MRGQHVLKLLFFLIFSTSTQTQSIITHLDPIGWSGRLGDMLIMYIKAKWVAFHHNVPFLYRPFNYSDQFELHFKERHFSPEIVRDYKTIYCNTLPETFEDNTVYTICYYFNLPQWGEYQKIYDSQEIMSCHEIYNDKEFMRDLKNNLAPHNPMTLDDLPSDSITVAVHIRRGGGVDLPILSNQIYTLSALNPHEAMPTGRYADKEWPFKFPPLQYYVDQIKRLSEILHDAKMYVYVYTDDQDPATLTNIIANATNKENITFDCRKKGNHHAHNVVEDMVAMAHYDCLIRSGSNYPQISQMMGNHRIVMYPKSCRWIGNNLIIDQVGIFTRDQQ